MKLSIFKKVALWLLIIIGTVEAAMMIALYSYTYNNAVNKATSDIKEAARFAANQLTFFNPETFAVESNEESIIISQLDSGCNQYDIDKIYLLLPDLRNNTVMYLERGINAKEEAKPNTHSIDDLTGNYVEGGMTAEMKKAFLGDDSGVTAHIQNEKEDMLVCYMPVINYADSKHMPKSGALISAEISISGVMEDINAQFRDFAIIMFIVTITVGISAAVILYFMVTKPLKFISSKMKGFVSDRNAAFKKLPVKGSDELALMSASFNTMVEEIDRYIDDETELNRQKSELNIAQSIQIGLLEPQAFKNDDVTVKASLKTAKIVGGDLYDYHVLPNGNVFVAIADVSGKGITAALFMSRALTLLNQYAELGYSPAKMLFEYNNNLAGHNPNLMFITTFAAVYNPKTKELIYSNAGHNYPYILSDKLITLNEKSGLIAGVFANSQYPEYKIQMKAGDKLFLFTDGVTEAQNKEGEFFGEEMLEKVLLSHIDYDGIDLMNAVTEKINAFAQGAEQADDITMLVLQINYNKEKKLRLEAKTDNLEKITQLISELDVSDDVRYQLNIISEEVFVNICSYAYPEKDGEIDFTLVPKDDKIVIIFEDSGIPFNPGKNRINIDEYKTHPTVGGLGRHIVFSSVDDYSYERKQNKNVLTLIINT